MKSSIFIALLFVLVACQEEKPIWDQLTPAEQAAVRAQAEADCLAEAATRFTNFKTESTKVFSSTSWNRNKQWRHVLKNGETEDTRTDFQVWKQTATELYLWVKVTKGSDVTDFFLRLTAAENDDMIDDVKANICSKTLTSTSRSSTGPVSASKTYTQTAGSEKREFTDTYNFDFTYPAFFGANHNFGRKIVTKKVSSNEVISTLNLTSTFSSVTGADDLRSSYTDGYTQKFCEISTLVSPYAIPYVYNTCPATPPVGWNL
ncbi:MAG: hypothetical protein LW878_03830 [Proteobacteria bacterium]|nr:hypothetical protein [Pseudomonadota bacterium]